MIGLEAHPMLWFCSLHRDRVIELGLACRSLVHGASRSIFQTDDGGQRGACPAARRWEWAASTAASTTATPLGGIKGLEMVGG